MGLALVRSKSTAQGSQRVATTFRLATEVVVFTIRDDDLKVLLVRRLRPASGNSWTLPGGLPQPGESLEGAARRLLHEQTRLENIYLEQLYTFGEANRDRRGPMVRVTYLALSESSQLEPNPRFPLAPQWCSVYRLPSLSFDERRTVAYALDRLRNKLEYTTAGFELLPRQFTLPELQKVYEIILNKHLDKRNFRKKIFSLRILKAANSTRRKNGGRPARLYSVARNRFIRLKDRGILFPF